jgi:phosphoribosylaminoimidazolecarboxamide formyltransferase/IMP cyclohydrolase
LLSLLLGSISRRERTARVRLPSLGLVFRGFPMSAIKRALISVSDKRDVVDFARKLASFGVELLSTGGTARSLRDAGLTVTDVSTYTESPEIMDGRVKTLHPRVHGGLLMRDSEEDRSQLAQIGGAPIDLVVVNLYHFEATVLRGAAYDEVIENIDIGGPSMLRSAAKNHARVTVVVDPADYARVAATLPEAPALAERAALAAKAFTHTAAYDGAIAGYLTSVEADGKRSAFPGTLSLQFQKAYGLRYGENPHQSGAFYVERNAPPGSLARAESLGAGGKELSFNNLVDCEAALDAVREFEGPAAVVVKHTNPCGVASADKLAEAYRVAREADALSAFGGIVALNRVVDLETAKVLAETFLECIVAPTFDPEALELLRSKKNLRLLATGAWLGPEHRELTFKRVGGGLVAQDRDACAAAEAAAHQGRAPGAAVRLARVQARQVQRHRVRQRAAHGRRRRGPNVARGQRGDRREEGGRRGPGRGHGVGRILSLCRRRRGRGGCRHHGRHPARRLCEGRGGHRSGGSRRNGYAPDVRAPLPPLIANVRLWQATTDRARGSAQHTRSQA